MAENFSPRHCRIGRAAVGWSADELAAAVGIDRTTVERYERRPDSARPDARIEATAARLREALEHEGVAFRRTGLDWGAAAWPARRA